MKMKLSVFGFTFSDMRDILTDPCSTVQETDQNVAVTSYSPDQRTLASLAPVKVIRLWQMERERLREQEWTRMAYFVALFT